jgi:hypothetical protein
MSDKERSAVFITGVPSGGTEVKLWVVALKTQHLDRASAQ